MVKNGAGSPIIRSRCWPSALPYSARSSRGPPGRGSPGTAASGLGRAATDAIGDSDGWTGHRSRATHGKSLRRTLVRLKYERCVCPERCSHNLARRLGFGTTDLVVGFLYRLAVHGADSLKTQSGRAGHPSPMTTICPGRCTTDRPHQVGTFGTCGEQPGWSIVGASSWRQRSDCGGCG
jgi:hypothetical protein